MAHRFVLAADSGRTGGQDRYRQAGKQ